MRRTVIKKLIKRMRGAQKRLGKYEGSGPDTRTAKKKAADYDKAHDAMDEVMDTSQLIGHHFPRRHKRLRRGGPARRAGAPGFSSGDLRSTPNTRGAKIRRAFSEGVRRAEKGGVTIK